MRSHLRVHQRWRAKGWELGVATGEVALGNARLLPSDYLALKPSDPPRT